MPRPLNLDSVDLNLPCFPCPHKSVCCKFGTALTPEEGKALLAEFGDRFVFYDADEKGMWGGGEEFRTQTWNGRCAFFKDGVCRIHDHAHYPAMCRMFPFRDARNPGLPRAYDAVLCPEMAQNPATQPEVLPKASYEIGKKQFPKRESLLSILTASKGG